MSMFFHLKRYAKTCQLIVLNLRHVSWSSKGSNRKRIILCVDGKTKHGGFVDRLKGIVSFYEVAKATNRDFYIHHTHPFELDDYLHPNQIDWKLKGGFQWYPLSTFFLVAYNRFDFNVFTSVPKIQSDTIIVYSNVDYTKQIYSGEIDHQLNWKQSFEELFCYNKSIQLKAVNLNYEKVFHTRFTSLLGDFKDTTELVLQPEKQIELMQKVLISMQNKAALNEKNILVLSDSYKFLEYIEQYSSFKVLEGRPVHMDHIDLQKLNRIDDHEKTILDFLIISKAKNVTLFQIDNMYNSNFSKFASFVGNSSFEKISS